MMTFIWFCLIVAGILIVHAAPSKNRTRQPSWFDLQPYMSESKKAKGRIMRKRRKR